VNKTESICHVLGLLFFTSAHEPYYISRISIIQNEEDTSDDDIVEGSLLDVMTQDEGCEEIMNYRLHFIANGCIKHSVKDEATDDGNGRENEQSLESSGLSFRSEGASFPSKSPLSCYYSEDGSSSGEKCPWEKVM
jgi:hypothetical protein